eukprot:CAMPEP_0119003064 /NCGR_PEP_ID=MMETSP1176-20130426/334_1 /TAXON_ID=265551 /ORGANISM="Synedropsis recta cf, Strain CCMP1620" /LENGTH=245 /DNA_ID=CAMNT_0006954623 /DNA_START=118 /DNA_END=855 /DNA_ORIENTATION=+
MADLRSSLDASSLDINGGVKTWLQTGNVIFQAAASSSSNNPKMMLEEKIQGVIQKCFGFKVPVMVRTLAELQETVARNPLAGKESKRLFFAFLQQRPEKDLLDGMDLVDYSPEKYAVVGDETITNNTNDQSTSSWWCICFYVPNFARYKLDTTLFEKKLKIAATSRNWKTVHKLLELMMAKEELEGAATASSSPRNKSESKKTRTTKQKPPSTTSRTRKGTTDTASITADSPAKNTRTLRKRKIR